MSKNLFIFLLLIFSFTLLPIYLPQEEVPENATEINITEDENIYSTDFEEEDPFKNFNFTNVLLLDDSNYTLLNKSEFTYILFYSQYCHHCHLFMPIFIETANYCKEKNLKVTFARIDGAHNENASEAYNIMSYPTVYYILNGNKYKYEGKRTKDALVNLMDKKINDDIYKITKLEEINTYKNKSTLVLLSTLKDQSSVLYKSFYEFAKYSYENGFLSCLSDECIKKYGEDIVLFKNFDEKEVRYSKSYGKISEAKNNSIFDFLSIFGVETGAFLTVNQIDLLVKFNKTAIFYVRNSSLEDDTKYDKFFKKLGKELRFNNTYTFVSDTGESQGTNIGEAFSILPEDLPGIFYYVQNTGDPSTSIKIYGLRNFDMNKASVEYIKKYIKDIKDGKIKKDLYSESPSESKIIGGMRYLVGRNFDQYVTDEKRNVFLAIVESESYKEEDTIFLDILKNLTTKYKDLSFTYINVAKNEPRDIFLRDGEIPCGFLYTNAMEKKEKIKFLPSNYSNINEEEIVKFLDENLKKDKTKPKTEEKEKGDEKKKDNVQTDL